MKEKIIKTTALVFAMDATLIFFLRNSEACNFLTGVLTLVFLGCLMDKAKPNNNTINYMGQRFFREKDGCFYSREQEDFLIQLDPEISAAIIGENNKFQNIPLNIIEGGEQVFNNVVSKFTG